jgi:U3 small nucleolar RNA-associated protein 3
MGKKRRSSAKGRTRSENTSVAASEPRTQLNVQSWEDVADSEDEFFLNQDKVLLEEGPSRKKLRKLDEEGTAPPEFWTRD